MIPAYRNSWIPEVFNDFFTAANMPKANATAPAINVREFQDKYVVDVAAPGMRKEDFDVNINADGDLTIKWRTSTNRRKNKYTTYVASLPTQSLNKHSSCPKMWTRKRLQPVWPTECLPSNCPK